MPRGTLSEGQSVESDAEPSTLWEALHWGQPMQTVQPVVSGRVHTYARPEDGDELENSKPGKKPSGQTTSGVYFSKDRGSWYVEVRRYEQGRKVRRSKSGFSTHEEAVEYMDNWLKTGVLNEVWD